MGVGALTLWKLSLRETSKEERERKKAWSGEAMERIQEMFRIYDVKFPLTD